MLAILLGIVSAEQCDSGGYPRIVIGCWQLLERTHDQSQAVATLQSYVKAGFTAFDTADIYGPSEEILGKLRREIARSSETPPRFFTKYVTGDSSLQEARRVNAKSRASLGAVPDMVQFHWWDFSDGGFVQAAQHLVTLQKEGKLTDVAACNFDVAHLRRVPFSTCRIAPSVDGGRTLTGADNKPAYAAPQAAHRRRRAHRGEPGAVLATRPAAADRHDGLCQGARATPRRLWHRGGRLAQ